MVPALADVGALGALADGVEAEGAGEALEVVVVLADRGAGLEPLGFGRGRRAGGGNLDQIHHGLIVAGARTKDFAGRDARGGGA